MDNGNVACGILGLGGLFAIWALCYAWAYHSRKADEAEEKRINEEQAKKQREFTLWYNSLTTEEKTLYQLERQNKLLEEQGRTGRAIAGMVATHNMFDTLHRH